MVSDEELLGRIAAGDEDAYSELMCRWHPTAKTLVLRMVYDTPIGGDADDIVSIGFSKLYYNAGSYNAAKSQPLTWFSAMLRHLVLDHLRVARKLVSLEVLDLDAMPVHRWLQESAYDLEKVELYVAELSQYQQHLFFALKDGKSTPEIASQLNSPYSTVRRHVVTLLQLLRTAFDFDIEHWAQENTENHIETVSAQLPNDLRHLLSYLRDGLGPGEIALVNGWSRPVVNQLMRQLQLTLATYSNSEATEP